MKWIGISLGGLVGVSHIAMIGLLATREQHPSFNLPVGEHTAYTVKAGKDGYSINYRANDPRVLKINKNIKKIEENITLLEEKKILYIYFFYNKIGKVYKVWV